MPGRVILLLILSVLLFSCNHNQSATEKTTVSKKLVSEMDTFYADNELICIKDTTETAFEKFYRIFKRDTSEAVNIKPYSDVIKRKGDSLIISFLNGKNKIYVNKPLTASSDDFTQYYYYGKLNPIGYHVLFVGMYESFTYLLVNEKNGKETYVCGIPVISPNKKYLAATCCDLEAGFVFNGIQMYNIGNDSVIPVWKRELTRWGADEMAWMNDRDLVIKKQQYDTTHQNLVSSFIKLSCCSKQNF